MADSVAGMQVQVEFVGPVRRPWPQRRGDAPIEVGATVASLLAQLGFAPAEARFLSVLVNGARVAATTPLAAGDHVVVALMVGGG